MAPRIQIPILILTGFLGSGKTSLLAKWLRAPVFEGAMVVVNELGEVGLDDRLVQHSSDAPLLLENGCACCEAAEDLNATLERLFWQRLQRQIPKFNWVLIETTGIADPALLLASLRGHQLVNERYGVRGVATTFDARRGPAHLDAHEECRNQLRAASTIILTKTDIASAGEQAAAVEAIKSLRPDAAIIASAQSSVTAQQLIAAIDGLPAPQPPGEHGHDRHRHQHDHRHDDDHAHHHAGEFTTAFAPLPDPVAWDRLAPALAAILASHGDDLLRLKGTARTGANGGAEVVQAITGEPFERTALEQRPGAKPVRTGLTIIARRTPAQDIAADLLKRLGLSEALPAAAQAQGAAAHA